MKEIICFLIIYFFREIEAWDKNKAGPYDVIVERVEPCPGGENDLYHYTYKLKKFNRSTVAVDVDLKITTPFDNDVKVSIVFDQFANNGWKENYLVKEFDKACSMVKTLAPNVIETALKIAEIDDCPIPVGNYTVINFPLIINIKTIPAFFYNKYKIKMKFDKGESRLGCFYAYADVIPKRIIRKG